VRQPLRVRRAAVVHARIFRIAKKLCGNRKFHETRYVEADWYGAQQRRLIMSNQNNPNQNPGQQTQNPGQNPGQQGGGGQKPGQQQQDPSHKPGQQGGGR
jgi:hypothetical protein